MSDLLIQPVTTRRQRTQFLNFPWELHRDDPNWMPSLRRSQEELLNYRKHPFYERNEIQTFLALRDGRPVGRVAAIINRGHIERYKEQRGFFGFFDSIDDQEVANGLFDAVRDWLAERKIGAIRGPCNPSLNYEVGLLIDGFDTPPFFMMTHNPPYYERLVETWGFRKAHDLFAYWGHISMLDTLDKKLAFVVEESQRRFAITTRRFDPKRFHEDVRSFLNIYNGSLDRTWGYVPLSDAEVDHMANGLRHLLVPEMTTAAIVDGQVIGCCFGMLDYNPRIKASHGRLFPFGFIRLLWNRRAIKPRPPDQHDRAAGIPDDGRGSGAAGPDSQGRHRVGHGRRGILLGPREQPPVAEVPGTRRRQRSKTYRLYDYPPPPAPATTSAAEKSTRNRQPK